MYLLGPFMVLKYSFVYWFADYILKVLQAGTGWPIALLIIAFWFKREISSKIAEIIELSFGNVKAKMQKAQAEKTEAEQEEGVEQVKALATQKQELLGSIEELRKEKTNFEATAFRVIDDLVNKNSALQEQLSFEKIFRIFYGSQIVLMGQLQLFPQGVNRLFVENYFNNLKQLHPIHQNDNVDRYVNFLIGLNFVEMTPNVNYKLTETGAKFLKYVADNGYPNPLL